MTEQKLYLGGFEEIVLLSVLRLKDEAYGVRIRQLIEQETGRSVSIGAVYTTLERLGQKGYISSWQGEATAERGGRAKKYFKVEGAGALILQETQHARTKMWSGLGAEWQPVGGTI